MPQKHPGFCFLMLVLLICETTVQYSRAQSNTTLDSLLNSLTQAKNDSNKVWLLFDIGEEIEKVHPQKAKSYYNQALALSKKIGYKRGHYIYASDYFYVLNMEGQYDSAMLVNQQVLDMALQEDNPRRIATILGNMATTLTYKGDYQLAAEHFIRALPYVEKSGDLVLEARFNVLLMCLYWYMKQYDKGVSYGEKAVAFFSDKPQGYNYANALMNLSNCYMNQKPPRYELALKGFYEVLPIFRNLNIRNSEVSTLINIADCLYKTEYYDEAESYDLQALEIARELNLPKSINNASLRLGYCALRKNKFEQAESYFKESLGLMQGKNMRHEEKRCLAALVDLAYAKNDYEAVNYYEHDLDSLSNVLLNESIQEALVEMEVKYESEKKAMKIQALEKEKRQNLFLSAALTMILILALIVLLFRQRLIKNQKSLAEQEVKRLQQEKQLVAVQATLQGETAERSRLARDLHDGLGGMLSVVKLNLNDMKTGAYMEQQDVLRFDKAISLLDDSMRELRRVAHHMMPESLLRYGLKTALNDFVGDHPKLQFHYFGNEQRIDSNLEILIYRCAQELVNNALRHAEASHINLQIIQENDRISLTVQDDGKGFDVENTPKGMGLNNLSNRVQSFNGKMNLYSSPAAGTEIHIEFQLNSEQ